jgi:hypothetical protein
MSDIVRADFYCDHCPRCPMFTPSNPTISPYPWRGKRSELGFT